MKIGLISTIRNEIDIIRLFLKHVDALFDKAFLIDHRSIDGTSEIMKEAVEQNENWEYYLLDTPAKIQQKVTNYFIQKAFNENIDFLFFLDADEFIKFPNRNELEKQLSVIENTEQIGRFHWINYLPHNKHIQELHYDSTLQKSPNISTFSKIVLSRTCFLKDCDMYNSAGSHASFWSDGTLINSVDLGNLIHIPIRSKTQAINKAMINKIALYMVKNQSNNENYQFDFFINSIANNEMDGFELTKFTQMYENPPTNSQKDLSNLQWINAYLTSLRDESIALNENLVLTFPGKLVDTLTLIANALTEINTINPNNYNIDIQQNIITLTEFDNELRNRISEREVDKYLSEIKYLKKEFPRWKYNLTHKDKK